MDICIHVFEHKCVQAWSSIRTDERPKRHKTLTFRSYWAFCRPRGLVQTSRPNLRSEYKGSAFSHTTSQLTPPLFQTTINMAGSSSTALIEVKDGDGVAFAIVDKADEDLVSKFSWRYAEQGNINVQYVIKLATSDDPYMKMSHKIMGDVPKPGMQAAFIDGDTFNHTRSNLTICTSKEALAMKKRESRGTCRCDVST
jgi:hypothetical protein